MPQSVKLSNELIKQARQCGEVYHRSTAKQIEYWATIGKISEEFMCQFSTASDFVLRSFRQKS